MEPLELEASLRLGVKVIDDQHERFIGYLNDARDALERGMEPKDFLYLLNQLMDYTLEHFTTEEALMREHGFPDHLAHKERHDDTAERLFAFDRRLLAGDPEEARAFVGFLGQWLEYHIAEADVELAAFLKDKGVN